MAEAVRDREAARRRRANVPGGRRHGHRVLVSAEEEARLVVLAEAQGVTVPRLLVESTLSGAGETPTQRRHAIADLFALERRLAGVSLDLERVAAQRSGAAEAEEVLAAVRGTVARIEAAIDGLAAP